MQQITWSRFITCDSAERYKGNIGSVVNGAWQGYIRMHKTKELSTVPTYVTAEGISDYGSCESYLGAKLWKRSHFQEREAMARVSPSLLKWYTHSLEGNWERAWAISRRSSLPQNVAFLVFSIVHKTINKPGREGITRLQEGYHRVGLCFPWVTGSKYHNLDVLTTRNSCYLRFPLSYKGWPGLQLLHEAFSWSSHRYSPARNFPECYLHCNLNSYFLFPFSISPHMKHFKSMEGSDLQTRWSPFKFSPGIWGTSRGNLPHYSLLPLKSLKPWDWQFSGLLQPQTNLP